MQHLSAAWVTMIQCFSGKQEQPLLEQDLCPVSMSFILALGHLQSFLLPDYLLPHLCHYVTQRKFPKWIFFSNY